MAAKVMVQCRICKEKFNRNDPKLLEGEYYVRPSKNMYYHVTCYEEYQREKMDIHASKDDKFWFDATWDLLTKDLKGGFNFVKVNSQWSNFIKNKMTAKGMYFTLKYFYQVRHGDVSKSENGIGIIPHIYEESCLYWLEREERDKGICAAIEEQIRQAQSQNVIKVNLARPKKKTFTPADRLAAIADMEEDE